jgi:predicted TIM-barrel fold metal-dependent hydrolase
MVDRIISADSHVIEPYDLWEKRLVGRFKEAAPKLVRDQKTDRVVCDQMKLDFPVGLAAGVMRKDEDVRSDGRWDEDVPVSAYDPVARIAAMDKDGVAGELLFPTMGMSMYGIRDHELLWKFLAAFNDWMAEFCAHDPKRMKGIGMGVADEGHAKVLEEELERCKKIGLVGIMLPLDADDADRLANPQFDRFWAAAADLGMPVHFHTSTSRSGRLQHSTVVDHMLAPVGMQRLLGGLIFAGLFDRFPKLQIVSVENEASWISLAAQRADYVSSRWRNLRGDQLKNKRKPSEIIANQVSLTFTRDDSAPAMSEVFPVRLMWGSDFPHNVSTWPNSRPFLENQLRGRKPKTVSESICGNAASLYGFPE